jgi:hypothetical protein
MEQEITQSNDLEFEDPDFVDAKLLPCVRAGCPFQKPNFTYQKPGRLSSLYSSAVYLFDGDIVWRNAV